jgi:hypothetical protein
MSLSHRTPPVHNEHDEARLAWEAWAATPAGRLELLRVRLAESQRELSALLDQITADESVDYGASPTPDGSASGVDLAAEAAPF